MSMWQTFCFVWSLRASHETSHWNWNRQTLHWPVFFSFLFSTLFSFWFWRNIVTVHICNGCLRQMQKHFNCTVCYGYHLCYIYNGIIIEWLFDKIIVCLLLYILCWYKWMKYVEHTWCQCDFLFHFIDLKQKYRSLRHSSEITLKTAVHDIHCNVFVVCFCSDLLDATDKKSAILSFVCKLL